MRRQPVLIKPTSLCGNKSLRRQVLSGEIERYHLTNLVFLCIMILCIIKERIFHVLVQRTGSG